MFNQSFDVEPAAFFADMPFSVGALFVMLWLARRRRGSFNASADPQTTLI